jgi:uncharacterized protein with ParB-like and HNH nuclease domain
MSYTPRSLFRLLEDIDGHRLLLPHIQRPFVWEPHQTERLFDSLMRDYPVQTFLPWRTKEEGCYIIHWLTMSSTRHSPSIFSSSTVPPE